ncbi:hypothetical protein Pfo_016509 [Paulownia fortunei]|nr:hypothetical protein Pfo_016509 [Paulownia fortunei]
MLESCLSTVANAVNFIEEAATTMSSSNTVAITILIAFPVFSLLNGQETSLRSLVRTFFSTHNCHPARTTMVEKLKCTAAAAADDDLGTDCVVCLGQVSKGEKYRILGNCKHGFHAHCIDAWLQRHSTCPLCRSLVPQKCTSMMQYCSINQED